MTLHNLCVFLGGMVAGAFVVYAAIVIHAMRMWK